jgi:hypothetical protein
MRASEVQGNPGCEPGCELVLVLMVLVAVSVLLAVAAGAGMVLAVL